MILFSPGIFSGIDTIMKGIYKEYDRSKKKKKNERHCACATESTCEREDKITKERQDPMDGKGYLQIHFIKYCFLIPWSSFTQQSI